MDCMKVGKLILQLRTEKGLTQKQVASPIRQSQNGSVAWDALTFHFGKNWQMCWEQTFSNYFKEN